MREAISTALLGASVGSIYAFYALGIVVTYRVSGVLNFAQGALGMYFAFLYYQFTQGGAVHWPRDWHQGWQMPQPVALVLVVVVLAPLTGAVLDFVLFRRLRDAGAVVQIVATIGLLLGFQGLVATVWTSATTLHPVSMFPTRRLSLGGIRIGESQLLTIVAVIVVCGALVAFLRYTPLGIRMRAVVDRPEIAELMGVNAGRISAVAWGISTGFAALGAILVTPNYGTLDVFTLPFLVVACLGVAVIARLSSLPVALGAGLVLGALEFLTRKYQVPLLHQHSPAVPYLVLFLALLLPIRWPVPHGTSAPARALPVDTSPLSRRARRVGVLAAVLVFSPYVLGRVGLPVIHMSLFTKVFGFGWERAFMAVPALAIIFLSLVVLTGYAGQISLCQASLAGFGAFVCAHLVVDRHIPFLVAAVIAAAVTVPIGALLASRATRLPPLFLGLATIAVGAFMDEVLFSSPRFSHGQSGIYFNRTGFLRGPLAYYFCGLAIFGVCALLVTNLRRGRTGLALVAMRDSPDGLASLGTSLARSKLVIFCLSSFLAGLGGALFAGSKGQAVSGDYIRFLSLIFLALAVVGGISRWPGALFGASVFWLSQFVFSQPFFRENIIVKFIFHGHLTDLLPLFFGLGAIGLAQNPHGAVESTKEGFAEFRERRRAAAEGVAADSQERAAVAAPEAPRAVTFAHATMYHVDGCVLTVGKDAKSVSATAARRLTPCTICTPPEPPARAARTKAAKAQ